MTTNITINDGLAVTINNVNNSATNINDSHPPPLPPMPGTQILSSIQPTLAGTTNGNNNHIHLRNPQNNIGNRHENPTQNQPTNPPLKNTNIINDRNTNNNIHKNEHRVTSSSSIKHHHSTRKSLSSLSFDMRRVKKIRRLSKKIRSIEDEKSKELLREIQKIKQERKIKLQLLNDAKSSDLTDSRQRYTAAIDEIERDSNDKKRAFQNHWIKELNSIRKRAIAHKKNNEKATFSVVIAKQNSKVKRKENKIRISMKRKTCSKEIESEIDRVFNNWQNEINFNVKRATRAATKNKKGSRGQMDLHRMRFHLREDQVKHDIRQLLEDEFKFDAKYGGDPKYSNRFGIYWQDDTQMNEFDEPAIYQQPAYADRHHISGITTKLGFLNDPDIGDPYNARTRRTRAPRVNYHQAEEAENQAMYHAQEVHFFVGDDDQHDHDHHGHHNGLDRAQPMEVPVEEKGHNVTVGGFNIIHGMIVRVNYNSTNTTIDARVVSIKRNQLSAVALVTGKRKRIWYKELRCGKINIVPATAYR